MVSGYVISVIEHIKSMHLIFPADVEALYLDHLHDIKRQTSWAFVVGFFFPLLTSEIMLVSHLFADGDIDLPIMTIVRLGSQLLLFLVSTLVCLNCFGTTSKVNREAVWVVIICAVLMTMTFRHSEGDEAAGTALLQALLVELAFTYLPLRIPTAVLLLLLVSILAGVSSALDLNDLKRSEVGVMMSLTVGAVRTLALLEASQRRDWLDKTKSQVLKAEPDSSMSTDKGSFRDASRMESREEHAGDEHAGDGSVALPLPGELPSQLPEADEDGTGTTVPMRSKETRRTTPAPLRIQRISSLNSAKEKRNAKTGDGHCPSPRIRPARRRSEGNAAASVQRISIEALKDMTAQKPSTLKWQREAADPRDSGAASLVEPASPRRFNKHLVFANDEAGPPMAVVPSGSPLQSPLPPPSPLHGPSSPALHPAAMNSIDGSSRIISASSLWAETWSRDLSQASKRSGGRSEREPLSYSQSSSSLDSNPLHLPSLSHVGCQTDVIWKDDDWHCTRCAKPPSLPGGPPRASSKGKSRSPSKPRMKQAMELVGRVQGTWRLVYGPPNVSPWLKEFTIYRTDVFSEDAAKKLDFVETVRLTLGGGELILDNEEYLHRHGRSGQHLMFERTDDDFEFDDENVFVRQSSANSVESDSTSAAQVDADMGPWY